MTTLLPPRPVLDGHGIRLRPLAPTDAAAMFTLTQDAETARLTGSLHPIDEAMVHAHCDRVQTATDRIDYAITCPPDPAFAGEVVLNCIDWGQRSANFRIMLAGPAFCGRGIGTAATRLLLAHAFTALHLHRIELEVFAFNPRAQRSYTKAGFTVEGIRRDALWWDGAFHDAVIMSILQPEFLARQAALSTVPA